LDQNNYVEHSNIFENFKIIKLTFNILTFNILAIQFMRHA